MSYYFVIISPRDAPLYEAHLSSKPSTSSSFFASSTSSTSSGLPSTPTTSVAPSTHPRASSEGGGVFGFAASLQALAGGLRGDSNAQDTMGNARTGGGAGGGNKLGFGRYGAAETLQMIAHSSLDAVEDRAITSGNLYLKAVDRINEWSVSAFLVPGNIKLLILHEHRHDDGIRNFFLDVWELLVKTLMNPLHDPQAPIRAPAFDARVRASARKHL